MLVEKTKEIKSPLLCFHCGDYCNGDDISIEDKIFCCNGCKTVYELLKQNQLSQYYDFNKNPGSSLKSNNHSRKYDYLNDVDVRKKLISFTDGKISTVTFFIRQMHCSSCIWLLENLFRFNSGIMKSQVNFFQKQLTIMYSEEETNLKNVVQLLCSIGYEPGISLNDIEGKKELSTVPKNLYYKIGIAGFCFGNIMLLSFPEYLSFVNTVDPFLKKIFGYVIILLSLPVFFYCSSDYFVSAYKGLNRKIINIDFPLSLGIFVLFMRSLLEIILYDAPGYMDSLAGLVFFLLIGKLFQAKTFETLSFDRNYKSYFPVAITLKTGDKELSIPVSKLKPGDKILIRNGELIPADAILIKGMGFIDYSFVTGESRLVEKLTGDMVYAGGRQTGAVIELEVINETSQSYLTQLWNQDFSKDNKNIVISMSNLISKYFTVGILFIATGASLYWLPNSLSTALGIFTAVLIVACPCALALSTPFTFGNTLRLFGRNKFYLKNTSVIEKLANINVIVFDKTGTLTKPHESIITYNGSNLTCYEEILIKSIVRNSTHPLSAKIYNTIRFHSLKNVDEYDEIPGAGLEGTIENNRIKIGARSFVSSEKSASGDILSDDFTLDKFPAELNKSKKHFDTTVYLSINDEIKGYYKINNYYREDLEKVISSIKGVDLYVLSGDNEGEKENLKKYFKTDSNLYFRQSPQDKLDFVKSLQSKGKKILMIGDGLNDAGALMKSDIGISLSEDTASFSPACDAILDASMFGRLGEFLEFSKLNLKIIKTSFLISLIYNLAGLSFAVSGRLSPVVAAILMPLSSITVVVFTTVATNLLAKRKGLYRRAE